MSTLVANPDPAPTLSVTISVTVDANGSLNLIHDDQPLNDALYVKHLRDSTTDPVCVRLTIVGPSSGWDIKAQHVLDSDEIVLWEHGAMNQCSFVWAETDHEYGIEITASPTDSSAAPKKKMVYIKVRPEPELPD